LSFGIVLDTPATTPWSVSTNINTSHPIRCHHHYVMCVSWVTTPGCSFIHRSISASNLFNCSIVIYGHHLHLVPLVLAIILLLWVILHIIFWSFPSQEIICFCYLHCVSCLCLHTI
jgi:hypothetical protein